MLIMAGDDEITGKKYFEVVSYVHQEEMGDSGNWICPGLYIFFHPFHSDLKIDVIKFKD